MPASGRGRSLLSTPDQARGPVTLPDYEPPSYPLNRNAQHELHTLPQTHKLNSLNEKLRAAHNHLTDAAAEINDRLHERVVRHEKAKRKRDTAGSQESNDNDDEAVNNLRQATEDITSKLDEKVRDIIDAKTEVASVTRALQELEANVVNNEGAVAPTQSTIGASQFRSSRRRLHGEADDEEYEDSHDQGKLLNLAETLKRKNSEQQAEYQSSSLAERYSAHQDYVGFRRIVHDARYPDDNGPPLPHASTWFLSAGEGQTSTSFLGDGGTQIDDDDLEIASERISTKCPLTLRVMKNPYQSTKCPHNFEKVAILEMIDMAQVPRGEPKYVKCPECSMPLTASDLQPNQVLLRKIKRTEAAERARNEESDNEDDNVNQSRRSLGEELTSSPVPSASSMKRERVSQAPLRRSRRDLSVVPATQID